MANQPVHRRTVRSGLFLLLLSLAFLCGGCSTLEPASSEDAPGLRVGVEAGQIVRFQTKRQGW